MLSWYVKRAVLATLVTGARRRQLVWAQERIPQRQPPGTNILTIAEPAVVIRANGETAPGPAVRKLGWRVCGKEAAEKSKDQMLSPQAK